MVTQGDHKDARLQQQRTSGVDFGDGNGHGGHGNVSGWVPHATSLHAADDSHVNERHGSNAHTPTAAVSMSVIAGPDAAGPRDSVLLSHVIHSSSRDVSVSASAPPPAVYTGLLATPERVATGGGRNFQAMSPALSVYSMPAATSSSATAAAGKDSRVTTAAVGAGNIWQQQQVTTAALQPVARERASQGDSRLTATPYAHGFGAASGHGALTQLPGAAQAGGDGPRLGIEAVVTRTDPSFRSFQGTGQGVIPGTATSSYTGDEATSLGAHRSDVHAPAAMSTSMPAVSASGYIGHESRQVGAARVTAQPHGHGHGQGHGNSATSMTAAASTYVGHESGSVGAARVTAQSNDLYQALASTSMAFAAPEYVGSESSGVGSARVTAQSLGAGTAEQLTSNAGAAVTTRFARDSRIGTGMQTADVLRGDFAHPTSMPVAVRDGVHTETPMVPGRAGNSQVLFWTGQALVAEAVPMYTQDPDKGDALHAQDKYTSHERVMREELQQASAGSSPAGFRNEYETTGWRRDETNVWRGRKNGPSADIVAALLDNQLYELSSRPPQTSACDVMEATRIAYESDVG